MVLIKPTSIAHSGTSASIGTNGQVTFTAVTSLSLNGVFSATYDNYVIVMRLSNPAAASINLGGRLRAAGTDATGSNYVHQYIFANGTSVTADRLTGTSAMVANIYGTQRAGSYITVYGPNLSQPTAVRATPASDNLSASLADHAWTHSLSTAYDGITFIPDTSNITGAVQVYGVRS
jgi:hypothetical protein